MHKIVIDTNVLISTALSKSYPYKIIHDLIFEEKVFTFISDETIAEARLVIEYPKFKKYSNFVLQSKNIIDGTLRFAILVQPSVRLNILKDISDNKFLDVALSCHDNFLITGNSKHFPFKRFENTEIISPEKYWNTYWK